MLLGETSGPVNIGKISGVVKKTLGANFDNVWLSKSTLVKQLAKHPELHLTDYEDLSWALRSDRIIRDRQPNRLHIITQMHRDRTRTVKLTIKAARDSDRIFLISVHWLRERSVRRLERIAPDIPLNK